MNQWFIYSGFYKQPFLHEFYPRQSIPIGRTSDHSSLIVSPAPVLCLLFLKRLDCVCNSPGEQGHQGVIEFFRRVA